MANEKLRRLNEIFKKCPKCGNKEDVKIQVLTGNLAADDEILSGSEESYRSYQASCPCCGFSMRRRTVQELATAWNISKEKRVHHVKNCINGLNSVLYPGGCSYISRDAVEMWRDDDGSLEKLRKHLQRSVGKKIEFKELSDGEGMIVYSPEFKVPENFNSFEDYISTLK